MGLDAEPPYAQRTARILTFTGEIDLPFSDQALPKVTSFSIFGPRAVQGAVRVKQLKYLRERVRRELSPLFTRTSRTAAIGVDEPSGLELEVRNSFSVGEIDDVGQNL